MKEIEVNSYNVPAAGRSKNYKGSLTSVVGVNSTTAPAASTPAGGAADTAKVAQNLASDSTDWAKIMRKDQDERTENSLSVGKNLGVDGKATISELVCTALSAASATIQSLTATSATILGALTAATVSATTMDANTFIGDLQGNAATATKLKTARTIWGQSFDGSGNVDGYLSGATTVQCSVGLFSRNICIETNNVGLSGTQNSEINNFNSSLYLQYSTNQNLCACTGGGSVGIATTSPAYKLDVNGNMRVTSDLYADASVGTRNFASRTVGWNVNANGAADFRNVYADELRVQAFTADISQALAGSDYLTKSVSKLSANFIVPSAGGSVRIIVDDIEGMPATQCFSNGDYIRFRAFNRTSGLTISNVWGTVSLDTSFGSNGFANGTQAYTFTCTATSGAGLTVFKGSEVLDYGTSGSGLISRTTLDAMGSPYEQIATWQGDPSNANNYTVHARLGSLNGIANCNGYGLYTDNGFFTGKITVGDLTKSNNYLDFSNGKLTVQGDIRLSSGYSAVSTFDMSNGISLAVDNIQIGGRNLLVYSRMVQGWISPDGSIQGDADNIYDPYYTPCNGNERYMVSVYSNPTPKGGGGHSAFYDANKNFISDIILFKNGDVIVNTFTTPVNARYIRFGVDYRENLCKVEKGTKITDYTPAPEDVDASINLKVSKDGVIGAINLTSEAATISASKINLVGAVTIGALDRSVTAAALGGATPNDVSTAVNNIQIGGRNLLVYSRMVYGWIAGDGSIRGDADNIYDPYYTPCNGNEQYMVSVYSNPTPKGGGGVSAFYDANKNFISNIVLFINGEVNPNLLGNTFTTPVNARYIRFGVCYRENLCKVEKGTKITDYTPAPEDVAQDVTNKVNALSAAHGGFTFLDSKSIYTGTLTSNQVNAVAINANSITTGTLNADRIAGNSITADKIAANSITGDKIVGNTITADKIAANSITGDKIVGNTITADKIAANSITGDKLVMNTITALGNVTAGSFNIGSGNFVVDANGNMTAVNATISGAITASVIGYKASTVHNGLVNGCLLIGYGNYILPTLAPGKCVEYTLIHLMMTPTTMEAKISGQGKYDRFVSSDAQSTDYNTIILDLVGYHKIVGIGDTAPNGGTLWVYN